MYDGRSSLLDFVKKCKICSQGNAAQLLWSEEPGEEKSIDALLTKLHENFGFDLTRKNNNISAVKVLFAAQKLKRYRPILPLIVITELQPEAVKWSKKIKEFLILFYSWRREDSHFSQ